MPLPLLLAAVTAAAATSASLLLLLRYSTYIFVTLTFAAGAARCNTGALVLPASTPAQPWPAKIDKAPRQHRHFACSRERRAGLKGSLGWAPAGRREWRKQRVRLLATLYHAVSLSAISSARTTHSDVKISDKWLTSSLAGARAAVQ